MSRFIEKYWYTPSLLSYFFWPFSFCFQGIVYLRRIFLTLFRQKHVPVPLIVVGNLTVGGVGKTPLVIALVNACKAKGLNVGVVSRGYGAQIKQFPHCVSLKDTAKEVGDEPLLIARETKCPVIISPKRFKAAEYLVKHHGCNLIISDDGLQHYAMGRSLEIVVLDGLRGFGNGFSLPAGPLREGTKRLKHADFIIVNGPPTHFSLNSLPSYYSLTIHPGQITQISTEQIVTLDQLPKPLAAITGIGHPRRFFNTLDALNISHVPYSFPDHHSFQLKDLDVNEPAVIMTVKDAVKCQIFAKEHWYVLHSEAAVSEPFWEAFWLALDRIKP